MDWDSIAETTRLRLLWLAGYSTLATITLGLLAAAGRLGEGQRRGREALQDALAAGGDGIPTLRGGQLRCSWWRRRATIDTTAAPAAVWRDLVRLARRLPAPARLVVRGAVGDGMTTVFTVETVAAPMDGAVRRASHA